MNKFTYISIEEIVKHMTAEQLILWQQIRLITGENASIKQHIYYGGTASLFLTYDAHRLWLAFELEFSFGGGVQAVGGASYAELYNENNAQHHMIRSPAGLGYNGVAGQDYVNAAIVKNQYFSRFVNGGDGNFTFMKFIGLRFDY